MNRERLEQQLAFLLEIDKEKQILRQTLKSDGVHRENDAEHAWHMAVMVLLLQEYSNEPIDPLKTIGMLLIHDLVEIDAGDTYAYDAEGKKTQALREQLAADRIFSLLPPDQGKQLRALWEEFEAGTSPEARFAHVMDNFQPMMLNVATGGKKWKENHVKLSQVLERNAHTAEGSETLWQYAYEKFLKPNVENGTLEAD